MNEIALYLASVLTFFVALLHFGCLFWGAAGYRFLGAGERIVRLAEEGRWYPHVMAISVGIVLTVVSVYALAAAAGLAVLPFAQGMLTAAAGVFLLRALAFPLIKSRFKGNSDRFWYISSFCSLILGCLFAVGVWR